MTAAQDPAKTSVFFYLQDKIEQKIAGSIGSFGEKNKLRDACQYALESGGKRFRPLLVVLVAEALGSNFSVYPAALSVEFFHTASLIADDLPCMDNEEDRRGKPCTHLVFGEATALLASYALICAAFEKIHENGILLKEGGYPYADIVTSLALEAAAKASGASGATGGQFYDLFPPAPTLETIRKVIYKKTVTLFEVSFLFGWLFGGGDLKEIEKVKKTAYHFGMAFQIADDIGDAHQDEKNQRMINLAKWIGLERAFSVFEEEMRLFRSHLADLSLDSPSMEKMCSFLVRSAQENLAKSCL